MSLVGPTFPAATDETRGLLMTTTVAQTLGASDVLMSAVFACGECHRVRANAAGNIAVKRVNDAGFTAYACNQGDYIDGRIIAVGGTGSGSSAIAVVFEI